VSAISQAKKENPDVILRDLGLPRGRRLCRHGAIGQHRVPRFGPDHCLNCARRRISQTTLQAAAKAFFQKPVDHGVLLAAVDQIVDGPISMQPSAI